MTSSTLTLVGGETYTLGTESVFNGVNLCGLTAERVAKHVLIGGDGEGTLTATFYNSAGSYRSVSKTSTTDKTNYSV